MDWSGPTGIGDLATRATRDVFGSSVTYTAPGGEPETLAAVFDEDYVAENLGEAHVAVQGARPALDVRLADLLAGEAVQGAIVIAGGGRRWEVTEVQPDGRGGATLLLTKVDP